MGKKPDLIFLKSRHTDGLSVIKNVLHITNPQVKANQNHDEISLTHNRMGIIKETKNNK